MSTTTPYFQDREIELVLFDLDGTLADTALDLASALNRTLEKHNRPALRFDDIRPHVSHGSIALVQAGFSINADHPKFETYRQDLLDTYQDNIALETALFPEMEQVLQQLEASNIAWGIVTNKPSYLTDPLMDQMALTQRAACIVSGDTTSRSKPHPEPILHACRVANRSPERALYIGDAERDIEAGKRAGLATLTALFGYIAEHDNPEHWGADQMIETPLDIIRVLGLDVSQ